MMNSFFGRLMIDIEKKYLSNEDIELLKNKNIGGVILFSRNFESRAQIKDLVSSIKKIKNNLLVAVDQEGGRVQRFSHDFTKIPSMQMISGYVSAHNDESLFKDTGWLISSELLSAGIDINFAPVLDVDKTTSSIIGDRSFSNNSDEVIRFASEYIDGMHEAGMKSTGKHFPGHGGIFADSHIELPIDNRNLEELMDNDIKPFNDLSKKLDAIMCAHILFKNISNEIPSFSEFWIKEILKNRLNYKGLVISDDLSMKGAGLESCSVKALKSIKAGCDMALICNEREDVKRTLDVFEDNCIEQSENILKMKADAYVSWEQLSNDDRAIKTRGRLESIINS